MIKYLLKIFEDFPKLIKSTRNSPDSENLSKVHPKDGSKLLTEK